MSRKVDCQKESTTCKCKYCLKKLRVFLFRFYGHCFYLGYTVLFLFAKNFLFVYWRPLSKSLIERGRNIINQLDGLHGKCVLG